jgi:DNA-directed RNA polymerase subunit L
MVHNTMDIKVEKAGKYRLKLIIKGEDYTLGNLIQHALMQNENIEGAGFHITHPLIKEMVFEIRLKKNLRKPLKIIVDDIEKFIDKIVNIKEEIIKEIGD